MNIFTAGKYKFLLVLIVVALISSNAFAQVPPNDEPCGAIVLTPTASCSYVNYILISFLCILPVSISQNITKSAAKLYKG